MGRIWSLARMPAVHLVLICVAVAALYAPTLDYPFVYDDGSNIIDNPGVKDVRAILDDEYAWGHGIREVLIRPNHLRTLSFLTFWLSYRTSGFKESSWRGAGIALHVCNALFLYAFISLLFRTPHLRGSVLAPGASLAALLGSLMFALHPLATESVIYISQRTNLLAAFCYLGGMAAYLAWRTGAGRWRWVWYGLGLLLAAAGMKCKEIVFTMPVALVMVEAGFFPGERWGWGRVRPLVPYMLTMLIVPYGLMMLGVESTGGGSMGESLLAETKVITDVTRGNYFMTQLGVVAKYLRLMFWPAGQNVDHAPEVMKSAMDARVIVPGLILAAVMVLGVWLWRKGGDRPELRVLGFGVLGFFLALSIESTVFPIVILMTEYRTYVPSAFLFAGLSAGASMAIGAFWRKGGLVPRALAVIAVISVPLALAAVSNVRSVVWETGKALWSDSLLKNPGNFRPYTNLAVEYMKEGRFAEAAALLETVPEASKDVSWVRLRLASAYAMSGRAGRAQKMFESLINENPGVPEIRFSYAEVARFNNDLKTAEAQYKAGLSLSPYKKKMVLGLGRTLIMYGRWAEAAEAYAYAIAIDPNSAAAHQGYAEALEGAGRTVEAWTHYAITERLRRGGQDR